jgi:hypothetical protein
VDAVRLHGLLLSSGPAYPRGYKNIGLDAREPFEVADASPGADPVASPAHSPAGTS